MDIENKISNTYVLEKLQKIIEKSIEKQKSILKSDITFDMIKDCEVVSESEALEIIIEKENCIVGVNFLETKNPDFYLFSTSNGAIPVKFVSNTEIINKDALIKEILESDYADELLIPKLKNKADLISALELKKSSSAEEIFARMSDDLDTTLINIAESPSTRIKSVTPAIFNEMLDLKTENSVNKDIKKKYDKALETILKSDCLDCLDKNTTFYVEQNKKFKQFLDTDKVKEELSSNEEFLYELVNLNQEIENIILNDCPVRDADSGLYSASSTSSFVPTQEDYFFKFTQDEILENKLLTHDVDKKKLKELTNKKLIDFKNINIIKGGTINIYKPLLVEEDYYNVLKTFETVHQIMCSNSNGETLQKEENILDSINLESAEINTSKATEVIVESASELEIQNAVDFM